MLQEYIPHIHGINIDVLNEFNDLVIELFIQPRINFFNNMYFKQTIINSLICFNRIDTLSKLISMETKSIIKYFYHYKEVFLVDPYNKPEIPLYYLCKNKHTKIIEQLIALEHCDVSFYFVGLLCFLDDTLVVKIVTNHMHHTS